MPRTRKCKQCSEPFIPFNTLQKVCRTPACALKEHRASQERKLKKELAQRREALKSPSEWAADAQNAFNGYIRARDMGKGCISCGKPSSQGQFHAGHFRTVKAAKQLRFNTKNVHGQCGQCNTYESGNISEYRIALVAKIGAEAVEQIEHNNELCTHDGEYYRRIRKVFSKKAKLYRRLFR